MTDELKKQIDSCRLNGYSYAKIAELMNLSINTVKSYCRRTKCKSQGGSITDPNKKYCLNCGIEVPQNPGRKEKKFCSDKCRNAWWNSHPDLIKRKANYECTCANCKKTFIAYGNYSRKYCSHECYIEDRFGGQC